VKAVTSFLDTINVLSLGSGIDLLPSGSSAPEGAAIVPVSGECEAFLHLKGVIDVNKEIERLRGKRSKLEGPLNKLKDFMSTEDYSSKVPVDVQEANCQKLKSLEAELQRVDEAVEGIKKLCLSN
jgi:valyl-tRNA synthetase